MRAVFDTNVFIAALLTEGVCAKLIRRARRKQFELASCPFILQECERVLITKLSAPRKELEWALDLIDEAVQLKIQPEKKVTGVCRDASDDHVLACAVSAKADYLVSGDSDLLILKRFAGTMIVTPRDFELMFED